MCGIRALRNVPHALHTYNTTLVPNDNTHDMPNEGRAILRHGEAGLRQINFLVVVLNSLSYIYIYII